MPSRTLNHSFIHRKWECEKDMPITASRCKDIARQLVEDEPGTNFKVKPCQYQSPQK